jgi:hypothetical protein
MSLKCFFGHQWNGCKCERCGEMRDEGHKYNAIAGKCEKNCTICGKVLSVPHTFGDSYRCSICGEICVNFSKMFTEEERMLLSATLVAILPYMFDNRFANTVRRIERINELCLSGADIQLKEIDESGWRDTLMPCYQLENHFLKGSWCLVFSIKLASVFSLISESSSTVNFFSKVSVKEKDIIQKLIDFEISVIGKTTPQYKQRMNEVRTLFNKEAEIISDIDFRLILYVVKRTLIRYSQEEQAVRSFMESESIDLKILEQIAENVANIK